MTIKLFEMFSGYGGASFALKKASVPFECVGYSEIDKFAIQCYEQNHYRDNGEDCFSRNVDNYGDATQINPNELPDFNLLTGGFPCQAFSVAGKGLGEQDTRGTLFHDIIRIAEVKKPKYMLLENVKGLTTKKHEETFKKIISELKRIGYEVTWKILNSKEHGIPQNRERVFFVCYRRHENHDFWNFNFPEKEELKIFLKDILEDLPFRPITKGFYGFWGDKKRVDGLKDINSNVSNTLTTSRTHTTQYLLDNKRKNMRNYSKTEAFRLQGFKDDEINLNGFTDNQGFRLAGNGWDINLVSKIFKRMFK